MASAYSIYTKNPSPAAKAKPAGPTKWNPRQWSAKTRKRATAIGLSILALLLLTTGVWAIRAHNHNKLLASLKENPQNIRDLERSGKISREEGREAMQAMWEQRMDKQMDSYFALPPGKQRTAFLDKQIDEMEARRKQWEARAATQPWRRPATQQSTTRPTTRPFRNDPSRQLGRMQGGDPVRKSQRAEFMAAMRARMAQRGITSGGRGGFGGGMRGFGGGGGRRG